MAGSSESRARRDLFVDIALASAVLAALLLDAQYGDDGRGITIVGLGAALGATVPLLWRRRAPIWVWIAITPFVFLTSFTLQPYETVILAPAVAVFSVALYGERRRSLAVAALIVPLVVYGVVAAGNDVISAITAKNLAWVLLAMVAGDALRSRKAAAADLLQRRESEQRERDAEADRNMSAERLQIAREVHDVVAHSMVAINVQAGTAAHLIASQPEQAEGALREIKRVSGAALNDLRSTLGVLRDEGAAAPVRPTGRLLQLSELVQPLRASGVEVEVEVRGNAGEVPPAVGSAAYRIVQEALTNVVRHAEASHAVVRVGVDDQMLEVEVLDDGASAVNGQSPGSGNGLRGMRERASAIGGVVEAGRRPGGGWRVHASLPVHQR